MKQIPLTKGMVAVVDDDDYDRVISVGRWHASVGSSKVWYAYHHFRQPNGRWSARPMHWFLTGWDRTDHINGDGLDNRRENLRPATHQQNCMNKGVRSDSRTGFKGVGRYRQKDGRFADRWYGHIQVNGRRLHLGSFTSPEEAARAYDAAAREHFGEFARPNFPEVAA